MYLIYLMAAAVMLSRFISDKSDKSASLFFIELALIYREKIVLSVSVEINHPLIKDDTLVEGTDGEGMLTLGQLDADILYRLTAKHVLLPLCRAVWLLDRYHLLVITVNTYRITEITIVVRMGGDEGDAQ